MFQLLLKNYVKQMLWEFRSNVFSWVNYRGKDHFMSFSTAMMRVIKNVAIALATLAQWLECWPMDLRVPG